jgi:hypothetical protein
MHNLELERIRLQRKLSTLGEMLVSLESYQTLAKTGLSKQTAAVVQHDLLCIARHIGSMIVVSQEDATQMEDIAVQASKETDSKSLGDKVLSAIKTFKEWLVKAYKMVKDQVGALLTSFTALRAKVDVLRGAVKAVPENKTEVHIPAKLANQVSISGDMGDGHFQALRSIANFGAVAYPEAISEFYQEIAAVVKNFDPAYEASGMVSAIEQALTPLNFSNVDTETYPGNVMISHDETGYNYTVAEVEARIVEEDVVRQVRSSAELTAALNNIVRVIELAEKIEGTSVQIETAIDKVVEFSDALVAKVKDRDEDHKKNASAMVTSVLATTSKVSTNTAGIIRYLGRVLSAHLQIIDHEVKTATNSQRA